MPELKNKIIIGGGLSGVAAAYWASGTEPGQKVILLEKGKRLLGEWVAAPAKPLLIGSREAFTAGDCLRGEREAERMLAAWPGTATCDWLESLGVRLSEDLSGACYVAEHEELSKCLMDALSARNVEIITGFSVETISRQSGGGFRLWSREGMALDARGLLLATGGQRNHGMKLARELAAEVSSVLPAYVRLRLVSAKAGERLGPIERTVSLRCQKTGVEATGSVLLSARGLEGLGLSTLSARVGTVWEQLGWRLCLQVDWVPEVSGSSIRSELQTRSEGGGRRLIGATPLYGFSEKQWDWFLHLSRIDPATAWPRLKKKKLQSLVQHLKGDLIQFQGMGLPAGERAWSGGVNPAFLDASLQSLDSPGLYFAGEILDLLGLPGGGHYNLAWASAHVAGSAMALGDS